MMCIIAVSDDVIEAPAGLTPLPAGEIGEIAVLGPMTSQAYYARDEANKMAKVQLNHSGRYFHRMGDLGYFDDDGRLWFCGRKAHRVQRAGDFVCAVPVEQVLNQHPSIYRSAIVDVGQGLVSAAVELEKGHTLTLQIEQELRALVAKHLPSIELDSFHQHRGFPISDTMQRLIAQD